MAAQTAMPGYEYVAAKYDSSGSPQIIRTVVICSTPRSGSTLLAESLLSSVPSVLVHITRRDRIAQAVSLFGAATTNSWSSHSADVGPLDPQYSFEAIDGYVKALAGWESQWEHFFAMADIPVATIIYEDLVGSEIPVIDEIAKFAGVKMTEPVSIGSRLRRQADQWSLQTAHRYANEARLEAG